MEIDNSNTPEFAHHDSYERFARRVRKERRHATDAASRAFVATVLATASPRRLTIKKGHIFYRAQLGIREEEWIDNVGAERIETTGHDSGRMIPKAEFVTGGRANAAGIAYLYLGTSELTAISEVRPWIGATVSLAQFRVKRDLIVLDLSQGHKKLGVTELTLAQITGRDLVDAPTKQKAVWTDIDNAFSKPVSRSDEGIEYVPTQILAEAFFDAGYEAIAYRSNFGEPGYNLALFNVNDAEIINCAPYEIQRVTIEFDQIGATWYK